MKKRLIIIMMSAIALVCVMPGRGRADETKSIALPFEGLVLRLPNGMTIDLEAQCYISEDDSSGHSPVGCEVKSLASQSPTGYSLESIDSSFDVNIPQGIGSYNVTWEDDRIEVPLEFWALLRESIRQFIASEFPENEMGGATGNSDFNSSPTSGVDIGDVKYFMCMVGAGLYCEWCCNNQDICPEIKDFPIHVPYDICMEGFLGLTPSCIEIAEEECRNRFPAKCCREAQQLDNPENDICEICGELGGMGNCFWRPGGYHHPDWAGCGDEGFFGAQCICYTNYCTGYNNQPPECDERPQLNHNEEEIILY